MTDLICALILIAALCACGNRGSSRTNPLLSGIDGASVEVQRSCELAAARCSRCHTVERLLTARVTNPGHWKRYVNRMRLMPDSSISRADARQVVRCLVFRSFGADGLKELDGTKGRP